MKGVILGIIGVVFAATASAAPRTQSPVEVIITNSEFDPVPINLISENAKTVASGYQVFLYVTCASSHVLYTVPDGYRLIVEDVSGSANSSAATNQLVSEPGVKLSLRTYYDGTFNLTRFAWSNELPMAGGRLVTAYAESGSQVSLSAEGCSSPMNVSVSFSGQLVPVSP